MCVTETSMDRFNALNCWQQHIMEPLLKKIQKRCPQEKAEKKTKRKRKDRSPISPSSWGLSDGVNEREKSYVGLHVHKTLVALSCPLRCRCLAKQASSACSDLELVRHCKQWNYTVNQWTWSGVRKRSLEYYLYQRDWVTWWSCRRACVHKNL